MRGFFLVPVAHKFVEISALRSFCCLKTKEEKVTAIVKLIFEIRYSCYFADYM